MLENRDCERLLVHITIGLYGSRVCAYRGAGRSWVCEFWIAILEVAERQKR
jgi:hypothetical protein